MWKAAKEITMFLPNVVRLTARLAKDRRVSPRVKVFLGAALTYFLSPFDLIPDWIPVLGLLDDLLLGFLVLDVIFNYVQPEIVEEAWPGSPGALRKGRRAGRICAFFIPEWFKRKVFKMPAPPDDTESGEASPKPPDEKGAEPSDRPDDKDVSRSVSEEMPCEQ